MAARMNYEYFHSWVANLDSSASSSQRKHTKLILIQLTPPPILHLVYVALGNLFLYIINAYSSLNLIKNILFS